MTQGVTSFLKVSIVTLVLLIESVAGVSTLYHVPPAASMSGQMIEIEAILVGDVTVADATLFFRTAGQSGYGETPVTFRGGSWRGTIPPAAVTPAGVEYALIFRMVDGSSVAFPREDPLGSPHRLTVQRAPQEGRSFGEERGAGAELTADVLIIGPEDGETVSGSDVLIVASLFNVRTLDVSSVEIFLDDRNVTSEASVSPEIIAYSPLPLSSGPHTVKIEMKNTYGYAFRPVSWFFRVAQRRRGIVTATDEFRYSGRVQAGMALDQVDGRPRSIGETVTRLEGGWQWLNVRTDVRVTSDESEFRQPRNRYSVTVKSGDNITLNVGDFTPVFSPYTVDGKRIRGLGVDVDLNWFRLQMANGEIERAVQGSLDEDKSYEVTDIRADSLNGTLAPLYVLERRGYTFRRKVSIYRASLNLRNRFQLGINLQKAIDQIPTVKRDLGQARFKVREDALLTVDQIDPGVYTFDEFKSEIEGRAGYELADKHWKGDSPQDNVVVGFDAGLSFDDRRLTFQTGWAVSLLNRNIWDGAMTRSELDTVLDEYDDGFVGRTYDEDGNIEYSGFSIEEVDPSAYKDFFIFNLYTTPLLPIDLEGFRETPLLAIMNMPSGAYRFKMRAFYYGNTLQVQYSQVGPGFKTLANPYLSANLREFNVSDRVRLIENKMSINLEYKYRDNSILRNVADEYSQKTTSANLTFTPGLDLPSFSSGFQSVTRTNDKTEPDTLVYLTAAEEESILEDRREDTNTRTTIFSVNVPMTSGDLKYNLQGTFSSVNVVDLLEEDRAPGFSSPNTNSRSYFVAATVKYSIPLRLAFNLSGFTYQLPVRAVEAGGKRESGLTNVGVDATYDSWGDRLSLQGGLSFSRASGIAEFSYYGLKGGVEFNPVKSFVTRFTLSTRVRQTKEEVNLATLAVKFSANYVF